MRNETVANNVPKTTIHAHVADKRDIVGVIASTHYHDELELLPIFEGEFVAVVDGTEYKAYEGDVIFINSGVPHMTKNYQPGCISGLVQFKESNFLGNDISRVIKYSLKYHALSDCPIKVIKSKVLFDTLAELFEEINAKRVGYEIYVKSLIFKTIACLYREGVLSDAERIYNSNDVIKILPVLKHVNENYFENLTLDAASAMLSFDRSYFCRIFKSAVGATFTEYLNFVRISKAEKLLSGTDMSILEISEAVGFSSVSYFNRIFKKVRNCTPRHYRNVKYCNHI